MNCSQNGEAPLLVRYGPSSSSNLPPFYASAGWLPSSLAACSRSEDPRSQSVDSIPGWTARGVSLGPAVDEPSFLGIALNKGGQRERRDPSAFASFLGCSLTFWIARREHERPFAPCTRLSLDFSSARYTSNRHCRNSNRANARLRIQTLVFFLARSAALPPFGQRGESVSGISLLACLVHSQSRRFLPTRPNRPCQLPSTTWPKTMLNARPRSRARLNEVSMPSSSSREFGAEG